MATYIFDQPSAEVETGTNSNDLFISSNNNFGAGDQAFGMGGIDDFQYFADSSLTGGAGGINVFGNADTIHTFAAFILNSVETFTVINDSGDTLVFDLSSSSGITDLVASNGSAPTVFDQVTQLANVRLVNQTNVGSADFAVGFQAAVTAGATVLNLVFDNTSGDEVRIGTSTGVMGSPSTAGIEEIHLTVLNGDSTINQLQVSTLTTLIIDDAAGAFDATINGSLSSTITTVTNNSDGDATISASAAAQSVTFTGQSGAEFFTGGAFADTFNLGNGNNTAYTGGGANTVTTGSGDDTVRAQGTTDTVNVGGGNDVIRDTTSVRLVATMGDGSDSLIGIGGNFNASLGAAFDSVDMGTGFDVVFVDQGTTDAMYRQISNVEGVGIYTAGTTTLGANAQAAGVNSIFLGSGTAGNDIVNAGTFTTGLTVQAAASNSAANLETVAGRQARFNTYSVGLANGGGDDQVTTGTAVDYFLFRGDNALTDADILRAGTALNAGGSVLGDTLVLEGDTALAGGGSFAQFEFIALESAVGSAYRAQTLGAGFGNQYVLNLTDANAPTTGVGSLYINGSNLKAAVAGVAGNAAETVTINAAAVTLYGLDVTTGAADDVITLGSLSSRVSTQGGDDTVTDGAGDDVIDVGTSTAGGANQVFLTAGNNTVFGLGNNVVYLGTGNDAVFTGSGNDIIVMNGNLGAGDNLVDGGGFDAIYSNSGANVTDGMFAGVNTGGFVNGYEVLFVDGNVTVSLGANAARAGLTTIVGNSQDQLINLNNANFAKGMLVDLSAGGNDTVNLGSPAAIAAPSASAPTPAGLFDFIDPEWSYAWVPTAFAVDPATIDRSANANLVIAGFGNQTVNGGTGSDVVRIDSLGLGGSDWDAADIFAGGAGYDAIQVDNRAGGVTATINLTNVTGVELVQTLAGGNLGAGVDADLNDITISGGNVGTLTRIVLDNSLLNDVDDTTRYTLNTPDPDFAFNIFGAQAGTTLVSKINVGTNNNINFQGGAGIDILSINGGDLGATTVFNGGAGTQDAIIQTGGMITDDSYTSVDGVEILTASGPGLLQATLGAQAGGSGMTTIQGTTGNDNVLFDTAFAGNVTVIMSGGDDTFDARNAIGTFTFNESLGNITAADLVVGGANGADAFNIDGSGAGPTVFGNFTNVDGIEVYNISQVAAGNTVDLTLGNFGPSFVNGTQTFNITGAGGATNITTVVHGSTENASTVINSLAGNDQITLGSGNDIVNAGSGNDELYGGGGNDALNGGIGNDQLSGQQGDDTLSGGQGDDRIRGQQGNDTIFGDAGNDIIFGGAGPDVLNGGLGNDIYVYDNAGPSDSALPTGRDTVTVGLGDAFDLGLVIGNGAGQLQFVGNQANFGDAQASISAGGAIQAVYQTDQNLLWVDINNDGALNNNDLQIQVLFDDGLTGLTGANFVNTVGGVAAFNATFNPAV
ncbi:beta strand repeat-containing protein [Tsuneonella sp. HG222]